MSITAHCPAAAPIIPCTSGCFSSPIITTNSPLAAASFTMLCILSTKGHVASTTLWPSDKISLYICSGTPCALIITVPFGTSAASSTELITLTPLFSRSFITSSLCMTGPKVYILPCPICEYTISTALLTPKQNPEFLATITSNCYFPAFSLNIDMILSVTSSIPISEESR